MSDLKDFFNIIFFLTVSIVAVLSYLQARKTLFSPIKTEIFKLQIEAFQDVLAFFNKRSSADFDNEFGFNEILEINSLRMFHSYIEVFFKEQIKPTDEVKERLRSAVFGVITSEEFLEEIKPGSELVEKNQEILDELTPEMKLAKWNDYKHGAVEYTKSYHEKMEELSKIAASPLLPKELTDKLYEFIALMHHNLSCIGETIVECSGEMPKMYNTPDKMIKARPDWIWNKFNRNRKDTSELTESILRYINEYLKVNEIMK
jgi:hypothetical protein